MHIANKMLPSALGLKEGTIALNLVDTKNGELPLTFRSEDRIFQIEFKSKKAIFQSKTASGRIANAEIEFTDTPNNAHAAAIRWSEYGGGIFIDGKIVNDFDSGHEPR